MMKFAVQAVALGVATFASTLTMADEKKLPFPGCLNLGFEGHILFF